MLVRNCGKCRNDAVSRHAFIRYFEEYRTYRQAARMSTTCKVIALMAGQYKEFLDAFAGIDFAAVEIALGIQGRLMKPMEISGIAAAMTKAGYHAAVIAAHDPDDVILPVGDQQILLLWVVREIDRPG